MEGKNSVRWPHAAAGTVIMIFLGALYAWSYLKVALEAAFPVWSEKQVTLNFTLMMCIFCLGGVAAGQLAKRFSRRALTVLSGVLTGIGFLGVSFLPQDNPSLALILLYLFYAGFTGLGTGIAFNAVMSAVQPWFPDRPGLISGAMLMGLSVGTLLIGSAAAALVGVIGLFPTFRVLAAADFAVLLALSPLIRLPGEGDRIPAAPQEKRHLTAAHDYTTKEMLLTATFWLYFFWNVCNAAGGQLVINSASSISVYYGAAATAGLMVSVFNGCGRLASGWLMDHLGWKKVLLIINLVMLGGGVLMLAADLFGLRAGILCGMMLLGLTYGAGIAVSSTLIRRLYGNAHYSTNFALANLVSIPASVIGPMISAALQDLSPGYTTTFLMTIAIGCAALAANLVIRPPKPR